MKKKKEKKGKQKKKHLRVADCLQDSKNLHISRLTTPSIQNCTLIQNMSLIHLDIYICINGH